jgi:hypothetical protein
MQDLIQAEELLQEDFPAKMSQSLAKGLVWLANEAGYSGRLPELWKKRKQSGSYSKTSLVCYPVTKEKILESSSGRWQTSGILLPGGLLMLSTSEFPKDGAVSSSLADVLQGQEVQTKYYLSSKACEGILRRSSRRGKNLPETLNNALVHQAAQSAD